MTKQERIKLTPARINAFICPPDRAQAFLWDSEVPGLAVRVTPAGKRTPTGKRAYVFQGYLQGSTPRLTIGDTKVWTLEEARIESRRLQSLLDQGIDPRDQKREQVEIKAAEKLAREATKLALEAKQTFTLRALLEDYCQHLENKGKAQSARQTRSILKCHVLDAHPTIAALPASEITSDHAAMMVRKVIEQGKERAAGILRSYLSAAFNAARKARFDTKLPASFIAYGVQSNPVEPIATIAVQRGNRVLSSEELKSYVSALNDDDLTDQALMLALLAGGQRMAQILRAKATDFNPDSQTLRLWDSKGKRTTPREHLLPLGPRATDIVSKLIERAKKAEDAAAQKEGRPPAYNELLLFSSTGKVQLAETTPGKRAAAICKDMKCPAFDLRDIRRTCETMLAEMGINRDTRAQLLSHGLSGVQAAHYDRHTYTKEKREALKAWEQRLSKKTPAPPKRAPRS